VLGECWGGRLYARKKNGGRHGSTRGGNDEGGLEEGQRPSRVNLGKEIGFSKKTSKTKKGREGGMIRNKGRPHVDIGGAAGAKSRSDRERTSLQNRLESKRALV